ncbi:hypothetical protein DWB79_01055 [Treponema medium]|uniref:Polymorphic outer membrane protein n=2 Tax=Treponema medium TaxID=58231 RepID=A0AA87NVD5_TREMD|nr:hypothetical protein [Treponema medium]EPF29509.1 hypothetical protein HMPREF9195_00209 [Treponema medium ATCC 700293]QSH96371.1 hypothetical protein DWB79_01055 [Treponema medium]
MRKLLIFLAAIVLCAGCENYQADIDTYLSYWSTQAAIVRSAFDPAITVRTDKDTIQSIPSSSNVTITFTIRNPKNFKFKLPRDADAPTDIVVFPTDIAGTTTSSPKQPDDYELTQDSYSQLTLTYKKEFLQKHEYGKKNIGSTITLYAKDGRKFPETFKLNVKANTSPPNLIYRAIGKTAAADVNGKHYYVLFLEVSGMDTEINGSDLLHKDIAELSIAEGSGSYTSIPLTVKADKSGFDINGAGGRLLEYSNAVALELVDVESGVTPDILPASTEKWILCVKTDVEVRGAVKQYRFRLQDEAGLFSEDELVTSTSINKVSPVHIDVQTGNWTTTMKSGSEAEPHEIVYQPGTGKVLLRVSTATTGATVYYKLERNSSVVSKSSGQTPQTIELPAVPDAVYKLTVWAEKEGYNKTSDVVVYYKMARNDKMEISAGPNAWGQLKAAVAVAEDGDSIFIKDTIKATSADGNSGAIEITKKVTIKSKNSDANTDILDANKDELGTSAHRIFTIKNGGELILENLTLKNGKAAGTGVSGSGGAVLIENGGTLTMTGCIVQECTAANSGGGIDSKGILTINGGMVGSTIAGSGNHASMGGGIFLAEGSCTLNGVAVQKNTINTESPTNRGSGIYLSKPSSGSAALTVTGRTQIGNNTAGSNTLCLGARSASQGAFNFAVGFYINIEPQDYDAQKNTTLVKLPNGYAALYNYDFRLIEAGSLAEGWVLISNDDDKELILKKGTAISGGGAYAWESLKDAISDAEAGDTIVVDGEITATTDPGNYGEISVTESITIRGNKGCGYDSLDANKEELGSNAHRIFNVTGSDTKLTLENIVLKNGKAAGGGDLGMGGGIYCKGIKELTIKGCVIMDCEADIEGGGICVAASGGVNTKAVITETSISGNTAGLRGGGIAFNPSNGTSHITGVLDKVTVENNNLTSTASDPYFNNGGAGVYFGGGYNDNSKYTVKGGTITGNNAGNYNGGGAYIKTNTSGSVNGTLTLKDGARISGNSAKSGGGIAVRSAKLIIEPGCTIGGDNASQGNTAKTSGGGISVGKKAECTIKEGVTIRHNMVTNGSTIHGGGGIYVGDPNSNAEADMGTLIVKGTDTNPVVISNCVVNGNYGSGGGIYNKGKVTLEYAQLNNNTAPDNGQGGGIYIHQYAGACVLDNTKITECEATSTGGGVSISGNTLTLKGASVITPSEGTEKGKNDVYLVPNAYIRITGNLSASQVARISMEDANYVAYSTRPVLQGDVNNNYRKFTVTPGGYPSQNWYVGSDGKLTTTQPYP